MGQMTVFCLLEIKVHLLSEFTKNHDPEILLSPQKSRQIYENLWKQ